MKEKDLLSVADLSREDLLSLISEAVSMKAEGWSTACENKILALLFEKPSLRTRVSFEVAMKQLGGDSIYLSPAEVGLGKRESVPDVARVLCRYVDVISARTFSHETLKNLAQYSSVPVINALSDLEHPCQAFADLLTIHEKKGDLEGLKLAYIGDGNNVANSLLLACALTGVNFNVASPTGYAIKEDFLKIAQGFARDSGSEIRCTESPDVAVDGVDIVYTDVWTSMGQEAESEIRRKAFVGFQLTEALMRRAKEDAIFMHPLPAHHGEEVEPGIVDSCWSVVFDQAENRMHIQKTILARMLGGLDVPLLRRR